MTFQEIVTILQEKYPQIDISTHDGIMNAIEVKPQDLQTIKQELHTNDHLFFDLLSSLGAVDLGLQENKFKIIYNLYSIPFEHSICVKTKLDRQVPQENGMQYKNQILPIVHSVSSIWKTAEWHEREAFDMFGIWFEGNTDMRRILLPDDWEGFPMRKDYETSSEYHGIKIDY